MCEDVCARGSVGEGGGEVRKGNKVWWEGLGPQRQGRLQVGEVNGNARHSTQRKRGLTLKTSIHTLLFLLSGA